MSTSASSAPSVSLLGIGRAGEGVLRAVQSVRHKLVIDAIEKQHPRLR